MTCYFALHNIVLEIVVWCWMYCIVLYCIVLYCIVFVCV